MIPTYEEKTVTMQSLDDIMSGRDVPVSEEPTPAPAAEPSTEMTAEERARDDKGRFAAKQAEAAAAAGATPDAPVQPTQLSGHVPIQALDAERNKRKEAEDRYDREMRELREQVARLSQPQKPAEPPKPPPSMWDDPDGYLQHQLSPVQQQMQEMRETLWETQATSLHGAEKVQAAKAAAEALIGKPEGAALARELTAQGNPFDNLVKWHQRQSTMNEIGGDLESYKAKLRAEIMAEIQGQSQPPPAAPPAAGPLPTAFARAPSAGPRGGQEYGGPRPLADIMKR